MSAAQEAVYEKFEIFSPDMQNSVRIEDGEFRIVSFDYYENILSPIITGKVAIVSSSGSAKSQTDTANRLGSLHGSLPLRVGSMIRVNIRT